MPELPELDVIRERLEEALARRTVVEARLHNPFVLRTVDPPFEAVSGCTVRAVSRQAKFLVIGLGELDLAIHLMLGGRLRLRDPGGWKPHRKRTLCSLRFDAGPSGGDHILLEMTEAGTRRRASLRVFGRGSDRTKLERGVEPFDPGLDVSRFRALLRQRNQHVARALRDPEVLCGIGNAYADEILFAARLSPVRLTSRLTDEEVQRLLASMRGVLSDWTDRVRAACPKGLPSRQADWRRHMAVHGKAGEACPACGGVIGRIARKDSETNYCPGCQTDGKLLADRRLSRLGIRRLPRKPPK